VGKTVHGGGSGSRVRTQFYRHRTPRPPGLFSRLRILLTLPVVRVRVLLLSEAGFGAGAGAGDSRLAVSVQIPPDLELLLSRLMTDDSRGGGPFGAFLSYSLTLQIHDYLQCIRRHPRCLCLYCYGVVTSKDNWYGLEYAQLSLKATS
jgi:hypothetical protein